MNGEQFKKLRLSQQMSQREFAELLGVSESHVANMELGYRSVSERTRARIAQNVDVSAVSSFFDRLKELERIIPNIQ